MPSWCGSPDRTGRAPVLTPEAEHLRLLDSAGCPVAVAARVTDNGATGTLSIDLSRPVDARAFLLERPDRLIVDLPETNFQIAPDLSAEVPPGKLIHAFRFGLFSPGKSRIVIDLGGPATLRKLEVRPIASGDPARLVVELARADRATFKAEVRRDQTAAPPPEQIAGAAKADSAAKPVIVIDPGHGGVDPGASGIGGATEKRVVFDFASVLAAKLTGTGRYKVVMTRTDDSFVSLGDRVRIAREAGAALLVSVHADTLSDSSVTGATVYTASDRASDAEAARVAASENRADEVAGLEAVPDNPGVSDILFDLTRRETRTYAHIFQKTLVGYWQKIARLNRNPERAAGFKVLQAPDVPSVLLELGYLSSDQDSRSLLSPGWRDKAADGVERSIDAFFGRRQSEGAGVATLVAPGTGRAAVSNPQHP